MIKTGRRPYRSWIPDLPMLRQLVHQGYSCRQIAKTLDRAQGSVAIKCRDLKLELRGKNGRPRKSN